MEELFITQIHIHEVRHLKDVVIPLSETERKHLILTGRNGSGKTSVLEALAHVIFKWHGGQQLQFPKNGSISALANQSQAWINAAWKEREIVTAYYGAKRGPKFDVPRGVLNINVGKTKGSSQPMESGPGKLFVQHLVNLWMDRLVLRDEKNDKAATAISNWFAGLEETIGDLLGNEGISLRYDRENRNFEIIEPGKNPYSFHQLSDGYGAVLDIVSDLIIRMQDQGLSNFEVPGIVLIDEIETHLHIDLQKRILKFLTNFFPRIQFIVTTHSPFVITSIPNAVVFDLENQEPIEDLSGYSYKAVVENYFGADQYSQAIKEKLSRYETLLSLDLPSAEQMDELERLGAYLEGIPKQNSEGLASKLQQLRIRYFKKAV